MPTIARTRLSAKEYSRYSNDLNTINFRLLLDETDTPIPNGATIVATLVQEQNGEVVATKTYSVSTGTPYLDGSISLVDDCWDADLLAETPRLYIYRAKQGWYHITFRMLASIGTVVTEAQSDTFAISIVSTADLKRRHAFGFPAVSNDTFAPAQQPIVTTGVRFTFVSDAMPLGDYRLYYDATAHTLQLTSVKMRPDLPTPKVPVSTEFDNTYVLEGPTEGDYVLVRVSAWDLPTVNTEEEIILDREYFIEDAYREYVWEATAYIEGRLGMFVEPTRYTTDSELDTIAHETHAPPQAFYPQKSRWSWMGTKIPSTPVLALHALSGLFNTDKVFDIPVSWQTVQQKTGLIEFVPRKGALTTWLFTGTNFLQFTYGGQNMIPNFWHYSATVGLPDLWEQRSVVRELIIKRAMIGILVTIGSAYRGGVSSESVSKEGASTAIGYTSSASLNVYGADITVYKEQLEQDIPLAKQRLRGVVMTTLP